MFNSRSDLGMEIWTRILRSESLGAGMPGQALPRAGGQREGLRQGPRGKRKPHRMEPQHDVSGMDTPRGRGRTSPEALLGPGVPAAPSSP